MIHNQVLEIQADIFARVKQSIVSSKCILLLCLCVAFTFTYCNKPETLNYASIVLPLKKGQLIEAEYAITINAQPKEVKQFLLSYMAYVKQGVRNHRQSITKLETNPKISLPYKTMCLYMYGDLMKAFYDDDTLSYTYYLKALDLSTKAKDTLLQNEVLKRLLHFFQRHPKNMSLYRDYTKKYANQTIDKTDVFWSKYYAVSYQLHSAIIENDNNAISEKDIRKLLDFAGDNSFFQARCCQLLGIYFDVLDKFPEKAEVAFNNAIDGFEKSNYHYSKKEAIRAKINKAFALKLKGEYYDATALLKKLISSDTYKNLIERRVIYQQLSDCFDALKVLDSSNYYLKQKIHTDSLINEYWLAEKIHHKDFKNRLQKVTEEKASMSQSNKSLFVIIIIVIVISIFIVFKWYTSQKNKKRLEIEHQQTIEKIKTIKALVIKDHIVLKNKAHVLLDELMYIKAEDHYLALFTKDKKEFVRGKIVDINKQLPPNFVRCHRSYIVNRNYIEYVNAKELKLKNGTYIPLSRTYKSHFSSE